MKIFSQIDDIRGARWADPSITWGLVPTMGYLHDGHLNLVRRAREENDKVGVSIFINPTQFNNARDLESYPRNLEQDLLLLEKEGTDIVWTPSTDIVYPHDFQTYVTVEQVTRPLEGTKRPGHFRGVTTVVALLFNVFQPHRAYFGQKDAQQVIVIKQMLRDLKFNLEIITCPTVREPDGLAMSSRNARLSPGARKEAICLYQALSNAKKAFESGEKNADILRSVMTKTIVTAKSATIDYVSVAHPDTLQELNIVHGKALLSLAVFIDDIRLIDNMIIMPGPEVLIKKK